MNKDVLLVNTISSTPSTTTTISSSSVTKLHITPMSPLNIQSLKNGFIDRVSSNHDDVYKQNGGHPILIHPNVPSPQTIISKNHLVQSTPTFYAPSNTTTRHSPKFTAAEMRSSQELDSKFLTKIIGNSKIDATRSQSATEKAIDYRNTVVRKSPGGTMQITYKNMINHHAPNQTNNNLNNLNKMNPIFILPKPVNGIRKEQALQQQQRPSIIPCSLVQKKETFPNMTNSIIPNVTTYYTTHNNDEALLKSIPIANNTDFNNLPGESGLSIALSGNPKTLDNFAYHHNNSLETDLNSSSRGTTMVNGSSSSVTDLNPFNGIDIDLSCFDTEPFEMLHQFYPCVTSDVAAVSTAISFSSCDFQKSVESVVEDVLYEQTTEQTDTRMAIDNNQLPETSSCPSSNELKKIIDVSPEIVPSTGGVKIILIGSWNAKDARYQCLFGQCPVDAELIQNGVLRCYSPKHKPDTVCLSVLCDNVPLSEQVPFTFVEGSEKSTVEQIDHKEWLSIGELSFVQLLVERIAFIADMIAGEGTHQAHSIVVSQQNSTTVGDEGAVNKVEDQLVDVCKGLMSVTTVDIEFDYKVEETMTVLHLASALGYIKLIQLLMNWVESNPNKIVQVEASPTSLDQFSLIPIMWSSAKGHFNTTCVLHQWDESTIEMKDVCGCTPLFLATENGYDSLVEYLGRLLRKSTISRENSLNQEPSISMGNPGSVCSTTLSNVDDSSPRTLGKTLAFIQSMLNENVEEGNNSDDDECDEESLFSNASVHARQRSLTDENIASTSQHSPGSPSQNALQSPFNRQMRETAEFCEFFYKAKKIEKDFAELTLTDQEQVELYRAANVIQTAYKAYKERRKQRDQEFSSATLIQSYYRRYKQYASFKKMQKGAVLIQNQYRAHREKAKKKCEAASLIQTNWRRYRQRKRAKKETNSVQEKNKLEQQAGRKANRYLYQTTKRFSRELREEFDNLNNLEIDFDSNS